jgi:hypothetical protein
VTSDLSGSRRSSRPSGDDTITSRPSGSQAVHSGKDLARATTSVSPARSTARTSPADQSEKYNRSSCQRGDSTKPRPVTSVPSSFTLIISRGSRSAWVLGRRLGPVQLCGYPAECSPTQLSYAFSQVNWSTAVSPLWNRSAQSVRSAVLSRSPPTGQVLESTSVSNAVVGWQYVGEWASLAAVAVALIAVVVSVWFSTKTLRRAINQFEKRRVDARTDKLRSEIIDLITALSERPSPSDAIINRIAALANKIDLAHPSASKDWLTIETKAVVSEGLSGTYRRIYGHAIGIMMLTDDEAVADPVRRITKAADEELEAFEAAISVSESVVDDDRRLVEQLRDTIQTAMLELVEYGLQNLRVAD